jgi:hypothetical protein
VRGPAERVRVFIGAIACAALLAACGGSSQRGDDGAGPRSVTVEWARAVASGNGDKACSLMTPASVRWIEKPLKPLRVRLPSGTRQISPGHPSRPCTKRMSHGIGPDLPVASTAVDGNKAVALMQERSQIIHRVVLFSAHGHWLVDYARTWDHPFGTD